MGEKKMCVNCGEGPVAASSFRWSKVTPPHTLVDKWDESDQGSKGHFRDTRTAELQFNFFLSFDAAQLYFRNFSGRIMH